ncbi:iron-dependent superoxide dismutase, putative [Theileria equi strain WA]|uniref:Superoxide dismutase n=1 Tax=Theileria equi strain WA TaxID=1537102 RepID=L0AZP2_THEEQ|nr:iron-dependent superoxide dismutase, putative [Theileria equi strain WA]AFZ80728.1 iron-dependent superoxide dismutase, putative [Theileria equi strain WA]|eukprot:XP_004830394.1 iron-dependent superoxide dismutase, putative [Theileria equi strain WA]
MELPYDLWSLSPEISEETLSFHYLKHHAGYVKKLNELIKTSNGQVYNMAAQVWNHDFYWNGLTPYGGELTNFVESMITESFGSYSNFTQELTKMVTQHFGSGWIWLLYEESKNPPLRLIATQDAENPIRLLNVHPVLVIDVWEHAYYIDYRNDRKAYVNGWLKKVNWKRVETLINNSREQTF